MASFQTRISADTVAHDSRLAATGLRTWHHLLTAAVAFAIFLSRRPDAILNAQFFAENWPKSPHAEMPPHTSGYECVSCEADGVETVDGLRLCCAGAFVLGWPQWNSVDSHSCDLVVQAAGRSISGEISSARTRSNGAVCCHTFCCACRCIKWSHTRQADQSSGATSVFICASRRRQPWDPSHAKVSRRIDRGGNSGDGSCRLYPIARSTGGEAVCLVWSGSICCCHEGSAYWRLSAVGVRI